MHVSVAAAMSQAYKLRDFKKAERQTAC